MVIQSGSKPAKKRRKSGIKGNKKGQRKGDTGGNEGRISRLYIEHPQVQLHPQTCKFEDYTNIDMICLR
jgi:hypothetical protein